MRRRLKNVKKEPKKIKKILDKITCPHCGVTGTEYLMNRWHFENCRNKGEIKIDEVQEINAKVVVEQLEDVLTMTKKEAIEIDNIDMKSLSVKEYELEHQNNLFEGYNIYKNVYLQQQDFTMPFIEFLKKFKYWLISENIHPNNLTIQNIYKFIKFLPNIQI
jgi:hypothetical protein